MSSIALGIDLGTSGIRSAALGADGVCISMARAAYPDIDPMNVDARLWWQGVEACLDRQLSELTALGHDPSEIGAIAVDGTSGTMVLTDADVCPVGPALMYNSKGFDDEASRIAQVAPDPHIARGGNSALARAMRLTKLAKGEPKHLLHQADFVAANLRGRGPVSDYNNALKTGYDPAREAWPDWIAQVFDPSLFPTVSAPGTSLGPVSGAIAERFGLSPETQVVAGTTDSIAAFLAAAPMEEGIAVTSLGSTLAVKLLSRTPIDDPEVGLYSHRLGDLWLVGGASNTGGAVLAQFFSGEDLARLTLQIDIARPSGLDYYPLLQAGERFPVNDPTLAPRLDPRPSDDALFLQGMLESMARIEAQCYRLIAERGGSRPKRVLSAGGGAKNDVWTTLRAREIGVEVVASKDGEACIGSARLARMALC